MNALLQILSKTCIEIDGISVFHALFAKHMRFKVIIMKICMKESAFSLGFHVQSEETLGKKCEIGNL